MKPAALRAAMACAAGLGALAGLALVAAGYHGARPTAVIEHQPMRIRFQEAMSGTMDAVRVERLAVRGRVAADIPLRQTLVIPLRGDYRMHVDFDQSIPLRMTIRYTAMLPVTTTAEIEAITTVLYGGARQYRNVRFRAAIPLQFTVPVALNIQVDAVGRVQLSGAMTATLDQELRVRIDDRLQTGLALDQELTRPALGRMRLVLDPDSQPVQIQVTHALLRWAEHGR